MDHQISAGLYTCNTLCKSVKERKECHRNAQLMSRMWYVIGDNVASLSLLHKRCPTWMPKKQTDKNYQSDWLAKKSRHTHTHTKE